MTNKEAINILTEQLAYSGDVLPARIKEAYEVAIYSIEESKTIKEGVVFYSNRPIEDIVLEARAEGESIGITRVLDILEHLDTQMLQMVIEALYNQDFIELKEKK